MRFERLRAGHVIALCNGKHPTAVAETSAFGSAFDGIGPSHRLLLQCEVSIKVDPGGFHRLVSEPKRNAARSTPLQQFRRGGAAEDMRRDSLLS